MYMHNVHNLKLPFFKTRRGRKRKRDASMFVAHITVKKIKKQNQITHESYIFLFVVFNVFL